MTFSIIKGMPTFVCDGCGEFIEDDDELGFEAMWAGLRERGWRAHKGRDWHHACPDCPAPATADLMT